MRALFKVIGCSPRACRSGLEFPRQDGTATAKLRVEHIALVTVLAFAGSAGMQGEGPTPAPATYAGCVMQSPNVATVYLLATHNRCLVLDGKYNPSKSAGHEAEFKGALSEASGNDPASLNVESVIAIKSACSRTCKLPAPSDRGYGYQTTEPDKGANNGKPAEFPPPSQPKPPHP